MKYRKKPVEIEAVKVSDLLDSASHDWESLPDYIQKAYENGDIIFAPDAIHIRTLEGNHRAEKTDMIIRGVKGELYPCKPDVFEMTYDKSDKKDSGIFQCSSEDLGEEGL